MSLLHSMAATASAAARPSALLATHDLSSEDITAASEPVVESPVLRGGIPLTEYPTMIVSACTKLGRRKVQEDRCTVIPCVRGNDNVTFIGIFDGTVGEHAAELVHAVLPSKIADSVHLLDALASLEDSADGHSYLFTPFVSKVEAAILEGYAATDAEVLRHCALHSFDYSACTSVTALLAGNLLSVAHLGDSKIVLGREVGGMLVGKYLTLDHKPDVPAERMRIEKSGGEVTYLHGGKPFLRGGDFVARQAKGDRPMQLNYSRAFGGKDLKPYGLSALPDVKHIQVTPADRFLIVASDGLWDVSTAETAVTRAWASIYAGRDPAVDLTDFALATHDARGSIDNVTVAVLQFR